MLAASLVGILLGTNLNLMSIIISEGIGMLLWSFVDYSANITKQRSVQKINILIAIIGIALPLLVYRNFNLNVFLSGFLIGLIISSSIDFTQKTVSILKAKNK
ncbi:MAG: hypothetical protein DRJ38_07390 [Thermoprotei archaeon]|nr:MAG: hypothetical protein DRJ38_07390 [Thermoprotei archaeon]